MQEGLNGSAGAGLPGYGGFPSSDGFNAYGKQPAPTGNGADVTHLVIADLVKPEMWDAIRTWRTYDFYELYFALVAAAFGLRLWLSESDLHDGLADADPTRVFHALILDLERRAQGGEKKYGTRLKTNNGRSAVLDCYQESLDAVCYVRQKIEELNGQAQAPKEAGTTNA